MVKVRFKSHVNSSLLGSQVRCETWRSGRQFMYDNEFRRQRNWVRLSRVLGVKGSWVNAHTSLRRSWFWLPFVGVKSPGNALQYAVKCVRPNQHTVKHIWFMQGERKKKNMHKRSMRLFFPPRIVELLRILKFVEEIKFQYRAALEFEYYCHLGRAWKVGVLTGSGWFRSFYFGDLGKK